MPKAATSENRCELLLPTATIDRIRPRLQATSVGRHFSRGVLPNAQDSAKHNDFADVVRIVVDDQQCLSQERLAISPRKSGVEVARWVAQQFNERLAVGSTAAMESFHSLSFAGAMDSGQ